MNEETGRVSTVLNVELEGVRVLNLPCNLIQRVEDERVSPHSNRNRIVTHRQTIRADKQSLRVREDPYAEQKQQIHEVA